jgi:membrane protease YdiL (CAAX protease family)
MDLEPLPTPGRRPLTVWLSWLVILGLTILLAYRSAATPADQGAQEMLSLSRARIAGLFAMQFKSLAAGKATPFLGSLATADRLVTDLEREARTDADRLRAAIVRGELHDGDDALKALDRWFPNDPAGETTEDLAVLRAIYETGPETLDADSKEKLIERHGDLGRLALSYNVDPDTEPRRSLQSTSFTFMIRMIVVAGGFMLLMLLVVGLFILACVWVLKGKISPAYTRGEQSGVFVEGFALYFILFLGLSIGLRFAGGNGVFGLWLALPILLVVAGWLVRRGRTWTQVRDALGWHTGRGWLREAGAGIAGYLAGLVLVAVGGLVTLLLVRLSGTSPASPVVEELQGGPLHIVGVFAAACIVAPILEETMFRGVLFHHLRERWGWAISAPTVALIFAAIHPQGWVAIPVLGSIAIVLAGLREWRGSLIAPIVAHACNNFLALAAALMLLA